MIYKICKNGNGKYKVQYRIFFIWWNEKGPQWNIRKFNTMRDAEYYIKNTRWKKIRGKINTRKENDWQCEGEY